MDLDVYAIAGIVVTVVSIIVSAIVSYLVARHYGSRWVYERQALRDHAMALVGDIQGWAHSIKGHTEIGLSYTEYGPEGQSGIRRSPTGFNVLEASDPPLRYVKQLREHFNTGYPDIYKSWGQLKSETTQYNNALAAVLNALIPALIEIAKKSGALTIDGPALAEYTYRESEAQMKTGYILNIPPPSIVDKETYSSVTVGRDKEVAQFPSFQHAKAAVAKTSSLVERIAHSDDMRELLRQQDEFVKRRQTMTEAIEGVERRIRLGNLLQGKCGDCPT